MTSVFRWSRHIGQKDVVDSFSLPKKRSFWFVVLWTVSSVCSTWTAQVRMTVRFQAKISKCFQVSGESTSGKKWRYGEIFMTHGWNNLAQFTYCATKISLSVLVLSFQNLWSLFSGSTTFLERDWKATSTSLSQKARKERTSHVKVKQTQIWSSTPSKTWTISRRNASSNYKPSATTISLTRKTAQNTQSKASRFGSNPTIKSNCLITSPN